MRQCDLQVDYGVLSHYHNMLANSGNQNKGEPCSKLVRSLKTNIKITNETTEKLKIYYKFLKKKKTCISICINFNIKKKL